MTRKVFVVGVGMTKFVKPNTGGDYPQFAKQAAVDAIKDAGIRYDNVHHAICGHVTGKSTSGQRVLYQIGMTGIPIFNVNNNGATGSSALFLAKQLIEGNVSDVVLVLGFEKMKPRELGQFNDKKHPIRKHVAKIVSLGNKETGALISEIFGNASTEHMKKFGTTDVHIAKIAAKNHRHGARNTRAQSQRVYNVDDILNSKKVSGPLTKLACSQVSDGAAAAILMSANAVNLYGLQNKAVEILGMEMATDPPSALRDNSFRKIVGYDMTVNASKRLYERTGVSPKDIDVAELHDSFAINEILAYESLGLCGEGEAGKFIDAGDNTYGGQVVVNPSGGLIARGHPLGATGVAQCAELVWQLRGEAGQRQVQGARIGLQHNMGLGGAVVVGMYRKGCSEHMSPVQQSKL